MNVEEAGAVGFLKDVYGRDRKVLEALDGEFVLSIPRGAPDYLTKD